MPIQGCGQGFINQRGPTFEVEVWGLHFLISDMCISRRLLSFCECTVKPAYFDLIGHLKYSDIDEQ